MAKTAYPTATDLESFLTGARISSDTLAELDLTTAIAAGIQDFEEATHRIMLAPTDDATRRLDPPTTNRALLFLDRDLATTPTSVTFQPSGGTAESLTLETDYVLLPLNAVVDRQPIDRIEFLSRWWTAPLHRSLRGSLRITGKWGWGTRGALGTGFPESAWLAMIQRGAGRLWEQFTNRETGGRLGWNEKDRGEQFGVETWSRLQTGWDGQYRQAVTDYYRWDL